MLLSEEFPGCDTEGLMRKSGNGGPQTVRSLILSLTSLVSVRSTEDFLISKEMDDCVEVRVENLLQVLYEKLASR